MDNQSFGTAAFTRSYDTDFVTGYGKRPYNWGLGLSVQQEVLPRVSVNVGYFRNWWGNWYVVDNRSTSVSDYTPVQHRGAGRSPAAGTAAVRWSPACITSSRAKSARSTSSRSPRTSSAKQSENWQGVDVNLVARLRNGMTVQGGTSTGRRLQDACAERAALPELGAGASGLSNNSIAGTAAGNSDVTVGCLNPYCRVVEPYLTAVSGDS